MKKSISMMTRQHSKYRESAEFADAPNGTESKTARTLERTDTTLGNRLTQLALIAAIALSVPAAVLGPNDILKVIATTIMLLAVAILIYAVAFCRAQPNAMRRNGKSKTGEDEASSPATLARKAVTAAHRSWHQQEMPSEFACEYPIKNNGDRITATIRFESPPDQWIVSVYLNEAEPPTEAEAETETDAPDAETPELLWDDTPQPEAKPLQLLLREPVPSCELCSLETIR